MSSPNAPSQSSASNRSSMSGKARFLETFEKEYATTLKVMRAYPADKSDLKPHPRSSSALTIGWTFIVELRMLMKALTGTPMFSEGGFGKQPETWNGVIEALEKVHDDVVAQLRDPKNANLEGTVSFYVAPKQMGEIPVGEFLWFLLHDQIHHRGQLTVYLRMAGGKVPSIYGPSADEPWM